MQSLKEYINEEFNPKWDYVIEMAIVGHPILARTKYNIALHGTLAGDRERPHIHIYLANDVRLFNKFNFEIALDELLCYNELNLIRMKDQSKGFDKWHRSKCSWDGYIKLQHEFEDWLYSRCELRGEYIDNLDSIIYWYNEESGGNEESNPLLEYISKRGMNIQSQFRKYFSNDDLKKYNI